MRGKSAMGLGRWGVGSLIFTLISLCTSALASAAPPHAYYVLSPEPLTGPISVMSLEPNNTISIGAFQLTLQQYETATVSPSAFTSGTTFSGTGFFTLGSNENAADLLVPDDFAGTSFVVPHISGSHRYFLLSPSGTAEVSIQLGTSTYNLSMAEGVVNEFDAGNDNGQAGRITSNVPIVITHVAYLSGTARDAYPVPPAANDLIGIRSQNTVLAALSSGTTVTAYASNGTSASYTLDAGEQVAVTVGANANQGQGSALRVIANAPVAAVQYDDGDGNDATAFWVSAHAGRRYGLPVDAQYVAIACDQPNVTLTLYKGRSPPESQSCSGSSTTPGKAYFGASTSGPNLAAGWYVISSSPVYSMYEAAASDDEHNTLGHTPPAGPATPTLNSVSSPTSNNPQNVSGTAGANQTVRLYVNGLLQATTTANGSGAYTFSSALMDGTNTLYTTAVTDGNESDPSNAVSVDYVNSIPRTQGGTISGTVVWTPGNPVQPYTITTALEIAAGAKLTLQPGTVLRFASGTVLRATGQLKIAGTAASPVVLTSNSATPTRGSWSGILINGNAGSVIEYATVEYTLTSVNVSGVPATVRNSTIRYFQNNGVYVSGAGSAGTIIQGNTIDNLNDSGDCVEANNSSPQVIGNSLTNCARGVFVIGAASPAVTDNVIMGNSIGVSVSGDGGVAALPVATGNQLYANNSYNYQVLSFGSAGSNVKLNATGNWWGRTVGISDGIYDLSDSSTSSLPSVDYSYYLDGPAGNPVIGNYLIGKLSTSTSLSAGSTYEVLGVLFVNSGTTLTVGAGATLRFHTDAPFYVDGALKVLGTANEIVTFTSAKPVPARNDWIGIRLRASGSIIEHARIEYTSTAVNLMGVPATVRNSTIRYFVNNGVYVSGAGSSGAVVEGNYIDNLNDSGDCVEANNSSPLIIGNTLTNCQRGVYVEGTATPTIEGNNVITGNDWGILVSAEGGVAARPVVTGNQLYANDVYNYVVSSFGSTGSSIRLDATGNWWGSTAPAAIGATIYDLTDATGSTLPTVDYSNFLDGSGGAPVPGNYLIGVLSASTSLLANTNYDVLGALSIKAGTTLTIPAGATLRFHAYSNISVDGVLTVQGTAANPVTFTSGVANPARNSWKGILLRSNGSLIEHARIDYTSTAVYVDGVTATVRNNAIRYFQTNGVYVIGAGASGTVVQGNTIENFNRQGDCIEANGSSPTITGNTLMSCLSGVKISGANNATTVNGNNIITGNGAGIHVDAGSAHLPIPTVTGNQLYGNSSNYITAHYANGGSDLHLNATGNWWGSTDLVAIGASITDASDVYGSTLPIVDYSGFLDGPGGMPVPGNQLIGRLTPPSTSLTAGTTYDVLGMLIVPATKTLIIPAGTTLRFHNSSALIVDGTLQIQGTSSSPVVLTSGQSTPTAGGWQGIVVRGAATDVNIDHAEIGWAVQGVEVQVATVTIRNSLLHHFRLAGIAMTGSPTGSLIESNVIDNYTKIGDGIALMNSSPAITGNRITRTNRAIYMSGTSAPIVSGNVLTGNKWGIYLFGNGVNTPSGVPLPRISSNDIYGNTTAQLEVNAYGPANPAIIDAAGNWWGTAMPVAGGQIEFSGGAVVSIVDFSYAAPSSVNFDSSAPSAPDNLHALAISASVIQLSWSNAIDDSAIAIYLIERCAGATCTDFVEIASSSTTGYGDVGLTTGTYYRYRVRAKDTADLLGSYSAVAGAVAILDTLAPSAPSALNAATLSSAQIDLSWLPSADNIGVVAYVVERCQGVGCSNFTLVATVTVPKFRNTGLTPATSYGYRVRARDAANNLSAYSNADVATTSMSGADCD